MSTQLIPLTSGALGEALAERQRERIASQEFLSQQRRLDFEFQMAVQGKDIMRQRALMGLGSPPQRRFRTDPVTGKRIEEQLGRAPQLLKKKKPPFNIDKPGGLTAGLSFIQRLRDYVYEWIGDPLGIKKEREERKRKWIEIREKEEEVRLMSQFVGPEIAYAMSNNARNGGFVRLEP